MIYRIACGALILFACLWGIGGYPLLDNNEGMYAAIARDMLATHQFIIPHLNGVPYLEKPPMFYWLMAASMALFGVHAWTARLVPALAFLATAWLMRRFVRRSGGNETASLAASLIFVTSLPLLAIGRMVLCDMLMTCFLTAALMGFYDWYAHDRRRSLLALYGFLALAVLTKGFVTLILAGGSVSLFLLWERAPLRRYGQMLYLPGILLFVAVAAPWHIAASLEQPGFAWFYFINEQLNRFLGTREPHDYYRGHWWYYLPRILAYLAPWTPFMAALLPSSLLRRKRMEQGHPCSAEQECPPPDLPPAGGGTADRFLWSWFLFCLLFFSASGAKANYYMVAGMPPLVMLLALRLERRLSSRSIPLLAAFGILPILGGLIAIRHLCPAAGGAVAPACEAVTWPAIGLYGLYGCAVMATCLYAPRRWVIPAFGAHVLILLPLLVGAIDRGGDDFSHKQVADYLKAAGYREVALFQHFEKWSALAFYLDQPMYIIDSQSEELLYSYRRGEFPSHFLSLEQWAAHQPPLPMVVLSHKAAPVMGMLPKVKTCILKQFEKVAVIGVCG